MSKRGWGGKGRGVHWCQNEEAEQRGGFRGGGYTGVKTRRWRKGVEVGLLFTSFYIKEIRFERRPCEPCDGSGTKPVLTVPHGPSPG